MESCTVKLDKSYRLSFGTKALRQYERDGGRSVADFQSDFGVGTVTYLIHAGLVYDHPEITLDDVDDMIDTFLEKGGDIVPVIETVIDAVMKSGWFQPVNPTKATASRSGKGSGATPAE